MSRATRIGGIALGGVLAVSVATAAALWPGNAALDPRLDASSVWVANAAADLVGVVNTQTDQLESIVAPGGAASEVVQGSEGVLVVDRAASVMRALDPATLERGPAVLLPAGSDVQVAGDAVSIVAPSSGDVWVTDVAAVQSGEELGDPVVQLGRGAVAALTSSTLFAASPGLGRVLEIDVATGETLASSDAPMSPEEPSLQITAVGERWVLLDTTSNVLSSRGWETRLQAESAVLQLPGPASGRVLVATDTGIEARELGVETVDVVASGLDGAPSRPLVHDGCVFGAWASGAVWRGCGADEALLELDGVEAGAQLALVARGDAVVLADAGSGDAWTVARDGALVDDWSLPAPPAVAPGGEEPEDPGAGADDPEQLPPTANDDALGARPGRVTLLPVLENDVDPNGDVLTVVAVDGDPNATIAPDGRSIRLALPADASGQVVLAYRISDGAGGEDTATATVEVRAPEQDEPPVAQRSVQLEIAPGEAVVANAFDHWIDPDGDALVLVDASSDAGDVVRFRGDGRIEIVDGGAGTVRDLAIAVSDGTTIVRGTIGLVPVEQPPLVAGTVTATTRLGQTTILEPLLSARGGDALSLHNVNGPAGVVQASYVDDTIAVTPDAVGTTAFTYVVSDGVETATGQVRVQVLPAVDPATPPQPAPHAVGVLSGGAVEVPVADLDVDPAGGVLVVTGASVDSDAVRVDVVDQERVRIELGGPLGGPATVRYGLSNGASTAEGTIEVVERDAAMQAPIARDDAVRVQPGGAVDVPVLANDEHPDGAAVELVPDLLEPAASGLAFVDGDRLRYVAADEPGEVSVTYEIRGPDGQSAFATVRIVVADSDAATNVAPSPPTVDARVVAGETVDIPIDLTTADPNGDGVALVGLATPASLGSATIVDGGTLRYEAGGYSAGTETLAYVVADDLGAQAQGIVRIGVAPPDGAVAPPIAEPDMVALRPGTAQTVDVLANDLDPAGLALDVVSALPQGDVEAEVVDGEVLVTAGEEPGEYGVVVTIESSRGAQAVGWLRVVVDEDAEPPAPRAQDVRVPVAAILDREQVVVDPMDAVTVADGAIDELVTTLPLDVAGTRIDADGTIRVAVAPQTRVVPYTVTREDTGESASALVVVPGTEDALPQLRPDAPPIVVASGETIEIDVDDYVVAVDGDPVLITDASSVRAEHSDGAQPVVDSRTLRFTSAPGYFGFASIAFEVTDGESPGDPDGRVASIVLPITVEPGEGLPGRVLGTTLQLEQGGTRELDLARITTAPDPEAVAGFSWSLGDVPPGFSATIDGSLLTVRTAGAQVGTTGELEVAVTGPDGDGIPGTLRLVTISSTRPLAQPQPDRIEVVRGGAASVDLLANDEATNPFPGTPLVLAAVDQSTVPLGVALRRAAGSSVLSVETSELARVGTTTVRYQVLDATGDPRRAVWSTLTIVVHDVPDRPAPPQQAADQHIDAGLVVRITPPGDGNSPILGYTLLGPNGYRHECGPSTTCTLTDLPVGVDVRLQVVARNAVGASEPSSPSEPMHADRLPAPVTGVSSTPTSTAGTTIVRWQAATVPQGATGVTGYLVRVREAGILLRLDAAAREVALSGLQPGRAYEVEVAATNDAGVADDAWRWSTPHPFTAVGPPGQTSVVLSGFDEASSTASVVWAAPASGGADLRYRLQAVAAGAPTPSCSSTGGGTPAGQSGTSGTVRLPSGGRSQIVVVADNGWFCSVSVSAPVLPSAPDAGDLRIALDDGTEQAPRDALDMLVTAVTPDQGTTMEVRVQGPNVQGAWTPVAAGDRLVPAGLVYGREYVVDIRQCSPGQTLVACSQPQRVGAYTPLSLAAVLSLPLECRWNEPLRGAAPPTNANATNRVVATFTMADGSEVERTGDANQPIVVPAGAASVQVVGQVTSGLLDTVTGRNPLPSPAAACSM
ncbi:Ig-like domain-containing protein [Agrococcus sp. SGAir0287]|uniref:Ig-like domain-containing protein n=1 Tax=Agrococcus sp. SGAir0287 TaxID=2070347 RepID=UPI0010CCC2F0|nr:Ig-like domain-containing protein [Agrococcus sp. SGAir0287]QCR19671.1 hypothetical protein C1N71_09760 [Agrococcus sp. SGAir0287]